MAEDKDVFDDAFGEDPEKKAALERQKKKQVEKAAKPAVSESPVTDQKAETSPNPSVEEKPKRKRQPPTPKPKIEPLVEKAEQRKAIKKIILNKAQSMAEEEKKGEEKKPLAKRSQSLHQPRQAEMEEAEEKGDGELEETDPAFLDSNDVDQALEESFFHESGIHEEGAGHIEKEESTGEEAPRPKPHVAKKGMPTPSVVTDIPLQFLELPEKQTVFIGRKKSVFKQFGDQAALYVGKVIEEHAIPHQHKVFLDSLNPHVVFVCGARGSGKCLTGDTLIQLDNGKLVEIQELEKVEGKILGLEHSLKIAPLYREGFFRRTVEKILKVTLRSGKEIKLTPEHPLLTVEGWRPVEMLRIGCRIATPRMLPAFGNKELRECEVKLLAYLLAEGHLSNQFVLFSNTDSEIQQDFFSSIEKLHPNLQIKEHNKSGCFRIVQKKKEVDLSHIVRDNKGRFTNKGFIVAQKSPLAQWMHSLGIYGKLSSQKFIPENILQLKKSQLALFLNRLFTSDGTIYRVNRGKNWCVGYCSSSEKMIRQVQNLLLRFGILSTLRSKTVSGERKKFKSFELTIYGENVIRFITEIGFISYKRKRQEIALTEMRSLNRNPNIDTIPKEIWKEFKVSNWSEVGRQIGYASPKSLHSTVAYAPSRQKLLQLAQIEQNAGIAMLAQADIFWDEIVGIVEIVGKTEVFDISVPLHHNFVANEIIVHNSYVLGVIAEELALKNPNVGSIVVDPIGVFWSMRLPNREEKEVGLLGQYDLLPQGLPNLKVFIPGGMAGQVPKSTFDETFSMQPSLLTVEDWCLTFGMDRFSPTGLLLEKALSKVKVGYQNLEGKKVLPRKNAFSLDDLIVCLETDGELNSRDKGYKQDSIRALVSRFEAAKNWGIFDNKGTPLSKLSREGQLTILDTSFLEDNVTSLVIGLLARRILAARKLTTRKEAAKRLKTDALEDLLELEIPPTWLFIDEAHTLIPSGNVKTPATNALVEYVKQGRRPGCSLVFATQQPAAIDTRVLSQLDIFIAHKLIFDDDIKAIYKRSPTIIPNKYKNSNFIKTLPVGVGLVADRREETSRAFVMSIRPRMSQHEGRDAETVSHDEPMKAEEVEKLVVEMIAGKLEKDGEMEKEMAENVVATMNNKYKSNARLEKVLEGLKKKKIVVEDAFLFLPGVKKAAETAAGVGVAVATENVPATEGLVSLAEMRKNAKADLGKTLLKDDANEKVMSANSMDSVELISFPTRVTEKQAERIADGVRKKRTFGLFGQEELVRRLQLYHEPIYRVKMDIQVRPNTFVSKTIFLSAISGEFVHFVNNRFMESRGVSALWKANPLSVRVLFALHSQRRPLKWVCEQVKESEDKVKNALKELIEKKLVAFKDDGKSLVYFTTNTDIPRDPLHKLLDSLDKAPFEKTEAVALAEKSFDAKQVPLLLQSVFPAAQPRKIEEVYRPYYRVELERGNQVRVLRIDAFNGIIIGRSS